MSTATAQDKHELQIDHFADDVREVIVKSQALADEMRHKEIQPLHLLSCAMHHESVIKVFKGLKKDDLEKQVRAKIEEALFEVKVEPRKVESYFSVACDRFFNTLQKDSSSSDKIYIDRFFALLTDKAFAGNNKLLKNVGVDLAAFNEQLVLSRKAGFSQMSIATLLKMEEFIGKRVIGQKEAVHAISRIVRRGKVGLNDPGRPIGSAMFLGPSGVGKTEIAKALTEFLYGDEKKLVRLDMSEFGEKHMAQRLIGSPPGYQDSGNGGYLTEAAKKDPSAVILFDEVEKAHPDVWNLLLQVLDDGRLTDGRGQTTDFSGCIILMTSNLGSKRIMEFEPDFLATGEGKIALNKMLRGEMLQYLRPELINRVDDIITCVPLNQMEVAQIVQIQLNILTNILKGKEMTIEFSQEAKDAVAELGYDPLLGGRPLKRLLLRRVRDPIAENILAGKYIAGSHIQVSYDGEQFHLG